MKTTAYALLVAMVFVIGSISATVLVLADGHADVPDSIKLINPLGTDSTIGDIITNVFDGLRLIAIPIVGVMILVGGFQIMFAGGDPEKFKTGKKTILYTVIGYAIILVASGISFIIQEILSGPVGE